MRITLNGRNLTPEDVAALCRGGSVRLARTSLRAIARSRRALEQAARTRTIYGVSTGFGPMASHRIPREKREALQRNLVMSHACGAGEPAAKSWVRAAMLVRLNTLLLGHSGVSVKLVRRLSSLINADVLSVVPAHGGVGASGDLVELAHVALPLIGEGEVFYKGRRMKARSALRLLGLSPYTLKPKEGLSLINGTSFMAGAGCLIAEDAQRLVNLIVRSSALALEVARARKDCIDQRLHAMRPHPGQVRVAAALRTLTRSSTLLRAPEDAERDDYGFFQDVYSIRCVPQIVGPALETLERLHSTLKIEINAATDNPLLARDGRLLHGGNFHGEYVAAALDALKSSIAKLSMLCERRINFFLNEHVNRRFPPFLNMGVKGETLGLQGLQFTATSTAAENQSLSFPHALHSIPTNGDNQDIVSMGSGTARLMARVLENTYLLLAIELVVLAQAVDCAGDVPKLSSESKALYSFIRNIVPAIRKDRPLNAELEKLQKTLTEGHLPKQMV